MNLPGGHIDFSNGRRQKNKGFYVDIGRVLIYNVHGEDHSIKLV